MGMRLRLLQNEPVVGPGSENGASGNRRISQKLKITLKVHLFAGVSGGRGWGAIPG